MEATEIRIGCEHTDVVDIDSLKPHPDNPNAHPPDQIKRLAKIIKYQGWRHPIIVSNQSGFIVAGHGRLEAAKLLGLKQVPIDYQDFASPDEEYAFLVSDNAVSLWAELDMAAIQLKALDCGPDFDTDWLGVKDFFLPNVSDSNESTNETETQFILAITLQSEYELNQLYEEMKERGLECKLIL